MNACLALLLSAACVGESIAHEARYVSYPFRDTSVQLPKEDFVQPESMPSQIVMTFDSDTSAGAIEGRFFPIEDSNCRSNSRYRKCFHSTFGSLAIPKKATKPGDSWQYHEYRIEHVRAERVLFRSSQIEVDVYFQSKDGDRTHGVRYVVNRDIGVIAFVYDTGAAYHLESDTGILSDAKQ